MQLFCQGIKSLRPVKSHVAGLRDKDATVRALALQIIANGAAAFWEADVAGKPSEQSIGLQISLAVSTR
jgi:hypothetical protein